MYMLKVTRYVEKGGIFEYIRKAVRFKGKPGMGGWGVVALNKVEVTINMASVVENVCVYAESSKANKMYWEKKVSYSS